MALCFVVKGLVSRMSIRAPGSRENGGNQICMVGNMSDPSHSVPLQLVVHSQ